jgi:hypothetical protein
VAVAPALARATLDPAELLQVEVGALVVDTWLGDEDAAGFLALPIDPAAP